MKQQSFVAELKNRIEYHRRLATLYEEALKAENGHLVEQAEQSETTKKPSPIVARAVSKGNPTRDWLRQVLRSHQGLTSRDIRTLAEEQGYTPGKNFPYTALWEWKKSGEVTERNSKYYAAAVHTQAAAAG